MYVPLSLTSSPANPKSEVYTKKRGFADAMDEADDTENELKSILW